MRLLSNQRTVGFLSALILQTLASLSAAAAVNCASPKLLGDPFEWLEEVHGTRALNWVAEHNARTEKTFQRDPLFYALSKEIGAIYNDPDRIAHPQLSGDFIYNFWVDSEHEKGILRRTSLESYRSGTPDWEVLLDVDALNKIENENWAYKGAVASSPDKTRTILAISRGGKDENVYREYDLTKKTWVTDRPFRIDEEARGFMSYLDDDTVIFGRSSLGATSSKYARQVRIWHRGSDWKSAEVIYEGENSDAIISGSVARDGDRRLPMVSRYKDFYRVESFIRDAGRLMQVPIPERASLQAWFQGRGIFQLNEEWKTAARTYRAGTLLSFQIKDLEAPNFESLLEVVLEPTSRQSIQGVTQTKSALIVTMLDNVRGKMFRLMPRLQGGWDQRRIPLKDTGVVDADAASPDSDLVMVSYEDFLTPASYSTFDVVGDLKDETTIESFKPERLVAAKPRFRSDNLMVEQFESTSKDGTKVPYFVVRRKDMPFNRENPTLMYGYGGFQINELPTYMGSRGKTWLERGGVYVLANIRGGAELGPEWHTAALTVNRQRAYDDFISVAEDLFKRKITRAKHLGIMGGSNGGLLVGAVTVQRPDLCRAVVCEVPLLDMMKYPELLVGRSWMGEYGDPKDSVVGAAIAKYSPYQNVKMGVRYPQVFFATSTEDDRVHPGHARKMAALLEFYGNRVHYYENMDGGHGGNTALSKTIANEATLLTYLWRRLQ